MKRFILSMFLAAFFVLYISPINAQQVGGPYTTDEHTMCLLHFDGNSDNESTKSDSAVIHGNYFFLTNSVSDLGQCLCLDNDSNTDSSYVTVADTVNLDLIGDWTLEGWVNITSFGEGASDWRWVPRLIMKPGDETFWLPNYFVEMWGDSRRFELGYNVSPGQYIWPKVVSPVNMFEPGLWYHMVFIRDTTNRILIQLSHNANREMTGFNVASLDPYGSDSWEDIKTPTTTNAPLHIGFGGGGTDSWLDGYVDEIRVSNVVREFPMPPVITNVTEVPNQPDSIISYEINAKVYTLFSSTLQSVTLYYDMGAGWQNVAMTAGADNMYTHTLDGQPLGTVIKYYVKAEDDGGLTFTQPQNAEAATDPSYYVFAIYAPETQTLKLSFEEGSGVPVDSSDYGNTVTVVGQPTYSDNAPVGAYSIYLEGDSSYLEVDSPFLNNEVFCVDLWFNADSTKDYCRIFNRPADAASWSQNTYQLRFDNSIPRKLQAISDGSVSITIDEEIKLGQWYHVIYEVQKAPADCTTAYFGICQLSDESDVVLERKSLGFDTPVLNATEPLRIGKSAGGDYPPYFEGYFDEIKIYNYAAVGLQLDEYVGIDEGQDPGVPMSYKLSQNYPNPFNPSTTINFVVPTNQHVNLTVYNILGKKVKTLLNKELGSGAQTACWNGRNESGNRVASGIYLYRLETDNFVKVRKMILMK